MSASKEATDNQSKLVTFIQDDPPPLKAGTYKINVEQKVNQASSNQFSITREFAVAGERFVFDPSEIHGVFPPNLAIGEYSGVLPQVIFNRRTLPWERTSIVSNDAAPWLAVLLFNPDEAPTPRRQTAKDLIAIGQKITVQGSTVTGVGALPPHFVSYPGINPLDYGETPDDQCMVIDVPVSLFNQIVPSAADLPLLAQIREVDTTDSEDTTEGTLQYGIVMGNRVPMNGVRSQAFLVSLENMDSLLPGPDGTASPNMPAAAKFVRLLTYRSWSFTADTQGEAFKHLLESLNKPGGKQGLTTLQRPVDGMPPTPRDVEVALSHQADGGLTDPDAEVLLSNALEMGYLPLSHHLRRTGQTVSWYRGPLVPYVVETSITIPISGPDAANRYNPQTGLFDVSYGAAWQLGQLLALKNSGFATALYNWKRSVQQSDAIAEEQELILRQLGGGAVFESLFAVRANDQPIDELAPDTVVEWIAKLSLLNGVPFQYLVPDESMLPPESLRFFYLDFNWMDALIDGAFSIGRSTTGEMNSDARPLQVVLEMARSARKRLRKNPSPVTPYTNQTGQITGFLLRSQVVSGWPRLNANGYQDVAGNIEIPKLRMSRLSADVLLCLFDGAVEMVAVHEPPEQLHSGVEGSPGEYTTTLRAVTGSKPGKQFVDGNATAVVPARSDKQTLMAGNAAANIMAKLNTNFDQGLTRFTSAEFALEMVKGVVEVEFQKGS